MPRKSSTPASQINTEIHSLITTITSNQRRRMTAEGKPGKTMFFRSVTSLFFDSRESKNFPLSSCLASDSANRSGRPCCGKDAARENRGRGFVLQSDAAAAPDQQRRRAIVYYTFRSPLLMPAKIAIPSETTI